MRGEKVLRKEEFFFSLIPDEVYLYPLTAKQETSSSPLMSPPPPSSPTRLPSFPLEENSPLLSSGKQGEE